MGAGLHAARKGYAPPPGGDAWGSGPLRPCAALPASLVAEHALVISQAWERLPWKPLPTPAGATVAWLQIISTQVEAGCTSAAE